MHYGRQVNKTIDAVGMAGVLDGYHMTRGMWNQTFEGTASRQLISDNNAICVNTQFIRLRLRRGLYL